MTDQVQGRLEFQVLGALRIVRGGQEVFKSTAYKPRLVLAGLLTRANQPVPTDWLVDLVWDQRPPRSARQNIQQYVHQIRLGLGTDRISTGPTGYMIMTGDALDADRFVHLTHAGTAALDRGEPARASVLYQQALQLWRGHAFAEFAGCPPIAAHARALEQMKATTRRKWLEVELALGHHDDALAGLTELAAAHPLDEQLCELLMVALYRSGRQADALHAFRAMRSRLVTELGVEPTTSLQQTHRRILRGEASLTGPAAATARPMFLPSDLPTFTGRAECLRWLDSTMNSPGAPVIISTIAGIPGVGKTALALHWAHRSAERFPDGALYVNLRGYDSARPLLPVEALGSLLRALGVDPQVIPHDVDEASGLYRSMLSTKRMLVLLDNARSVSQIRPLLPGKPDCAVLITSRDMLSGLVARDGARRLVLDALTDAEAYELLRHALGTRADAEARAVADLIRACGNLPLALGIAAAHLADNPRQTVASYVSRLLSAERLALLEVEGDPQSALRTVFGHSFDALPPVERRVYCLIGLFPGNEFTAGVIAAMAGMTEQAATAALANLHGCQLIQPHSGQRYWTHDLLRLYAGERAMAELPPPAQAEAMTWLCEHYETQIDAAARMLYPQMLRLPGPAPTAVFPDAGHAKSWLDAERTNLTAVIAHAQETGLDRHVCALADGLRGYLWRNRNTVDWLPIAQLAVQAAEAGGDQRLLVSAQISLAQCRNHMGERNTAAALYEAALAGARECGWQHAEATIAGNLGVLHAAAGALATARPLLQRAVDGYEQLGGPLVSVYQGSLGYLQLMLGDFESAHHMLTKAIEYRAQTVGPPIIAMCHRGETARLLGRTSDALADLQTALSLARGQAHPSEEAMALHYLASLHVGLGDVEAAVETATRSVELSGELNDPITSGHSLVSLGMARQAQGRIDDALASYEEAITIGQTSPHLHAHALLAKSRLYLAVGDHTNAAETAASALSVSRDRGFHHFARDAESILDSVSATTGPERHDPL